MKFSHGIRKLSQGYDKGIIENNYSENGVVRCVVWEDVDNATENDENDNIVKIKNDWPEVISLNASIEAENIKDPKIFVERNDAGKVFEKIDLYGNPRISPYSKIQNHKKCCTTNININFDNYGTYVENENTQPFFAYNFNEFQIELEDPPILFKKNFMTLQDDVKEIRKFDSQMNSYLEESGIKATCKIYPYGGYYEFGANPQEIESCVFRTAQDGTNNYIQISKLSDIKNSNINPTINTKVSNSNYYFIGIKNFSDSQQVTLYDELKSGKCKISVINTASNEKQIYKSQIVAHVAKTNLITISFIKE